MVLRGLWGHSGAEMSLNCKNDSGSKFKCAMETIGSDGFPWFCWGALKQKCHMSANDTGSSGHVKTFVADGFAWLVWVFCNRVCIGSALIYKVKLFH